MIPATQPENPFHLFWNLGYERLVPITPPDAELSDRGAFAARAAAGGDPRGKAPGAPGKDGKWRGINFVAMEAREDDLPVWASWGAGVGIKTGAGLIAVDVDTLDKASASRIYELAQLHLGQSAVRFGHAPKCLLVYAGPDDMPYRKVAFATEVDTEAKRRPAVEILTEGKQFVAHGIHPGTRKPYRWHNGYVAPRSMLKQVTHEQMDAFLSAVAAAFPGAVRVDSQAGEAGDQHALRAPSWSALQEAVEHCPNTTALFPDRQSYVTMAIAIKAAAPEGHEDAARDLWLDWCDRWEDPEPGQEPNDPVIAMEDWRRAKPPFRVGYSWIVERAASLFLEPRSQQDIETDDLFAANAAATGETTPRDARPPLLAGDVSWDDLDDLPPRRWLYGFKASRGYVTFAAAPGGVGKTAWSTGVALSCITGEPLLHDAPRPGPLRVWIMNLEDDIIEVRRRVKAAAQFYGLDRSALDGLKISSGRDRAFCILRQTKDGFHLDPDYHAIIAEMKRQRIDLLIVDPFLRSHRVSENDNEAQDEVMRLYAQIAHETQAAILLIHHTKKGAQAGDMDGMRGGSTQGGGARSVLTLAPMSAEEAARLGIPENERRLHVRIDDAKNNMAPPAARAEWIKLVSVRLNNGTPDYPEGDSVQVATQYTPPAMWEGAGEKEDTNALADIDAGHVSGERFSLRIQDKDRWAGDVLVTKYGRTQQQAVEILKTWSAKGIVEVREYRSEIQRKTRKGLFVNWVGIERPTPPEPVEDIFA